MVPMAQVGESDLHCSRFRAIHRNDTAYGALGSYLIPVEAEPVGTGEYKPTLLLHGLNGHAVSPRLLGQNVFKIGVAPSHQAS